MTFRDRLQELQTPEQVDLFLDKFPTCAIFKAGTCHKTMQGFGYVEEKLSPREAIHMGIIHVVECRPTSNYVSEITGITHQSPQFILFLEGKPVYDVDNWKITPEALEESLNQHLGTFHAANNDHSTESPSTKANIQAYISLIEKLLSKNLSSDDFKRQWLITFQNDASLRSTKEFSLLNSLYGDVDKALANKSSHDDELSEEGLLKQRAKELLVALRSE
jgi:bacillithiol system protein YtxJ